MMVKMRPVVFNPKGRRQTVNLRDALVLCDSFGESAHAFACRRANEAKKKKGPGGGGTGTTKKRKKGGRR